MTAEGREVYGKIKKLLDTHLPEPRRFEIEDVMETLDQCMHSPDSSELVRLFQIWGACV